MRRLEPAAGWPDLSDAALAAERADWLAPPLAGMSRLADLPRLDLPAILRGLLPWDLAARLDGELPTHLALPGGRAAIDYTQPVPLAVGPRAGVLWPGRRRRAWPEGRVPLRLALLSPAGRPVAITADLAGFWRGGLGRRAPRHARPLSEARLAGGPRGRDTMTEVRLTEFLLQSRPRAICC